MVNPRVAFTGVMMAAALLLAACGSASGSAGSGSDRQGIPDVTVTDVASGQSVALASVAKPDRPTLVWFWAPF